MKITKCWKCHQNVWLAETERGKTISMNTWTSAKGKIVIVAGDEDAEKPLVHFLKKDEEAPEGTRRYLMHKTTCRPPRKAA